MTPTQRAAALRLADSLTNSRTNAPRTRDEAAALLRELASEPVQEPVAYVDPRHLARKAAVLHCITRPEYRSWSDAAAGLEYTPVYLHPPQQRRPPREQITDAAKALCRQASTACNVDFDDNWKVYGDDYIADATAALNAAYGIGEQE